MPKPPTYELTDAEKRDLAQLIEVGKPLPEKYRFILFEDKREVELVWNGKTRDVCTTVLPFQTLEHVDEPRAETRTQGELFDARGRQTRGWTNKLIWGDNKLILSSLKAGALRRQIEDAGGLKLIYIDPPFDVGADFSMDIAIGGETFHKEPNLLEQIAYRDTWGRGADSFIAMIYERLILMRDLLAEDGSIYVHCDWRVNAYMRLALDEIFGRSWLVNDLVWHYRTFQGQTHGYFAKKHDSLLFYRKSDTHTYREVFDADVEDTIDFTRWHTYLNEDNCIVGANMPVQDSRFVRYLKKWREKNGREPGPADVVFEVRGQPVDSVWDLKGLDPKSSERCDYPTQKPEGLLDRIIKASSNEGDLVADFFAGSGTTAAVAEKLGRKWIATDLGKFAIHTTRKRLIGVQRELKAAEKSFRAFEVLNLGRYERQAYLNIGGRLTAPQKEAALAQKEREFRELILRAYQAEGFDNDAFFDGKRGGRLVVIGPINLPVGRLFVEEVIVECRKRGATRVDVLAFEFEMGLFPAVTEEAKGKGIDLTLKYIPRDVFDKRAVDRHQVIFHDVSFVEATPRYARGKSAHNKRTLRIELTDFSVYYSQGAADEAIKAMKNGKNGVICEAGQLVKISKDKDGIIKREVLTRAWTDWVDYWAVDFDYESREERIKVPVGADVGAAVADVAAEGGGDAGVEFEEKWTGSYIFENEWQSFRTRKQRELELVTADHTYDRPGRYTVAVKVVDIFGNDTMTLVPVNVG